MILIATRSEKNPSSQVKVVILPKCPSQKKNRCKQPHIL